MSADSSSAVDAWSQISCQDCIARLTAVAQHAQFVANHLHHLSELLQSATTHPPAMAPQQGNRTTSVGGSPPCLARPAADAACIPTSAFWHAWRTSAEAAALFHRSGMSTAFGTLESTITAQTVYTNTPRLRRLRENVVRLRNFNEDAGRRRMACECGLCEEWVADTVTTLLHAAQSAPSKIDREAGQSTEDEAAEFNIWAALEMDLKAIAESPLLDEVKSRGCDSKAEAVQESRLQQQCQHLQQLFFEVVKTIVGDASPPL